MFSTCILQHPSHDHIKKPTCNSEPPEILHHITVGINEVTRDLERHAKAARQTLTSGGVTSDNGAHNCSKLILVCRGDINPQILISHLPQLVASCNFPSSYQDHSLRLQTVWLVPLARGAEESLAEALGLRRASVLTMNVCHLLFDFLPYANTVKEYCAGLSRTSSTSIWCSHPYTLMGACEYPKSFL